MVSEQGFKTLTTISYQLFVILPTIYHTQRDRNPFWLDDPISSEPPAIVTPPGSKIGNYPIPY